MEDILDHENKTKNKGVCLETNRVLLTKPCSD